MTDLARYVRQMRFAPFGEEGQRQLTQSRVLVCGCGALGSVLAGTLVRAGVGHVRIADRDFVETTNLQRQVLFDEEDVQRQLPKAVAAAEKLRLVNSQVEIQPIVADVDHTNLHRLAAGVDLIVDGTDNFQIRFLLNDYAIKHQVPWVYGGCLGAEGQTMTILPGRTPCLRCLIEDCPPPGSTPTCDTAGILAPIVGVIASIEAMEAIKILSGNLDAVSPGLAVINLWTGQFRRIDTSGLRDQADCPACRHGEFPWLDGRQAGHSAVLCGRNAVQLSHTGGSVDLDDLVQRLAGVGQINRNAFLLRLRVDSYEITVFRDGRAIVAGTDDVAVARTLHARYIGN